MKSYDRFKAIKKYLSRLRVWNVDIREDTENVLCFELKNRWTDKYYYIVSVLKTWKSENYPFLYDVQYEQNSVGVRHDTVADITDSRSFGCEEYVIRYIRKSLRWHTKG